MKIAPLVIMSATGEVVDPAHNRQRPVHHPKPASAFPGLESLFPSQVRKDPALFNLVNKQFFTDKKGKRAFNPTQDGKRTLVDEFICTQNSMFLIHKTSDYDAFNTVEYSDFALNDANCNIDSANLAWFSVSAEGLSWSQGDDWTSNSGQQTSDPSSIEYVAAIIPLDACGTTAEMGKDDNDNDVVIFKNKVRNGAYSTFSSDTHNGITTDAVVDFEVQCSYQASYEMNSAHETEVAMLRDDLETDAGKAFEFDVNFLTFSSGKFNPSQINIEGQMMESVAGLHSVQVGETAYASIEMKNPNDLVRMQIDSCSMQNPDGKDGPLSYDFISGNCPDPFTSAKLINEPGDKNGLAVVSFTMFEFVDENLKSFPIQENTLECKVKICLRDEPCPGACPTP